MHIFRELPIFLETHWRWLRWLLLLLTISVQCGWVMVYGVSLEHDEGYQIGAIHTLLDGQGVGAWFAMDASDISAWEYRPLTWWPPAKTFAIAGLYMLTQDLWWATLLLEWLSVALLFAAWFVVLELLSDILPSTVRASIGLYWLFLYTVPVNATNLNALMLFWWALAGCLWVIRTQRYVWLLGGVIGVACALTGWFRYAYYPVLPIIGFSLVGYALWFRQKAAFKTAIAVFITGGLGIGLLLLYNQSVSGSGIPTYAVGDAGRTYYWQHLTEIVPFPAAAFSLNTTMTYVLQRVGVPLPLITSLLWVLSAVIVGVFVRMFWHSLRSAKTGLLSLAKSKPSNPPVVADTAKLFAFFVLAGGFAMVGIPLMLAVLSVLSAPQGTWTFVEEMRYYAPLWGFLAVVLLAFLFSDVSPKKPRWLQGIALIVLLVAVGAAGLTRIAAWSHLPDLLPVITGEARIQTPIYAAVKTAQRHQQPILYIGGSLFDSIKHRADVTLTGAAIYDEWVHEDDVFTTQKPLVVIVGVPTAASGLPEQIGALQRLVDTHAGVYVGEIPGYVRYYEVLMQPE